ncbi:MAG: demethoxyubiquinone hydroxylase family protein [Casimicrobium sp.]
MKLGDQILKVNHAGEHGAISIYSGQLALAWLTAPGLVSELREMREHERKHRAIFWAELRRRNRPRCKSYALCAMGGFTLGVITGLLGRKAIAGTTVAVEHVVLKHLSHQIEQLHDNDVPAVEAIRAILDDEQSHHDRSAQHVDENDRWFRLLRPIVAVSTESVIWLGMKL